MPSGVLLMRRVVLKFGGSSVSTIEKMRLIAEKIKSRSVEEQLVIVISAMGKTTNELLQLAKKISKNPDKRNIDLLLSTGEMVSLALFSLVLLDMGCNVISLTGFQAKIVTSGIYTQSKITDIDISIIEKYLHENKIVVVAGFQGINEMGDITTLGRGGSNTTAVALAAKLGCPCEIYTDVAGIYRVDPRIYPEAKKINFIDYQEMKEMAFLGAKVMEPRSIEIGERYKVPIYVASTHEEKFGSFIGDLEETDKRDVSALTIINKAMIVAINGISPSIQSDILINLSKWEICLDVVDCNNEEMKFIVAVNDIYDFNNVIDNIMRKYPNVEISKTSEIVKLSLIKSGLIKNKVLPKIFKVLAEEDIAFIDITLSEKSISLIINQSDQERLMNALAIAFNL